MLKLGIGSIATLGAGVAVLLAPSVARACSCVGGTQVGQRTELARNAGVLLGDFCGSGGETTVTVDGKPAQFTGSGSGPAYLRTISGPLEIGQKVVIAFEESTSEPVTLTVVEDDTTAPTIGVPTVELSDSLNPCGEMSSDLEQVYVRVEAPVEDDDVRYFFLLRLDDEVVPELVTGRFYGQRDAELVHTFSGEPAEICVDVLAVDAAGNESEVQSNCIEGPPSEGCSCRASDDGDGWLALPLLALLWGWRRDRGSQPVS